METTQSIATPLLHNSSFPQVKCQVNFVFLGTNIFVLSTAPATAKFSISDTRSWWLWMDNPNGYRLSWGCRGTSRADSQLFPHLHSSEACSHWSSMTGGSLVLNSLHSLGDPSKFTLKSIGRINSVLSFNTPLQCKWSLSCPKLNFTTFSAIYLFWLGLSASINFLTVVFEASILLLRSFFCS